MPEIPALPVQHIIDKLRPETLDLARRLDALLGHLADEFGFATISIEVKRGIPKMLNVNRSFKLDDEVA